MPAQLQSLLSLVLICHHIKKSADETRDLLRLILLSRRTLKLFFDEKDPVALYSGLSQRNRFDLVKKAAKGRNAYLNRLDINTALALLQLADLVALKWDEQSNDLNPQVIERTAKLGRVLEDKPNLKSIGLSIKYQLMWLAFDLLPDKITSLSIDDSYGYTSVPHGRQILDYFEIDILWNWRYLPGIFRIKSKEIYIETHRDWNGLYKLLELSPFEPNPTLELLHLPIFISSSIDCLLKKTMEELTQQYRSGLKILKQINPNMTVNFIVETDLQDYSSTNEFIEYHNSRLENICSFVDLCKEIDVKVKLTQFYTTATKKVGIFNEKETLEIIEQCQLVRDTYNKKYFCCTNCHNEVDLSIKYFFPDVVNWFFEN